jgi:hypothetical protein
MVTVELGGRVVNAETGVPLANVGVSVGYWSAPIEMPFPKNTATSGGDGTFTLPVNVTSDWQAVGLKFTGPAGYDDRGARFEPTTTVCRIGPCWAAAERAEIRMYPTLVIRPGESIDVRVQPNVNACAFAGGFVCRRVLVEASPGEPVELEIVSQDASYPMGLVESDWSEEPVLRLKVTGGVAFVYNVGTARLTARR